MAPNNQGTEADTNQDALAAMASTAPANVAFESSYYLPNRQHTLDFQDGTRSTVAAAGEDENSDIQT